MLTPFLRGVTAVVVATIVLSVATVASAQSAAPTQSTLPDFRIADSEPQSLGMLPWLTSADLYYQEEESFFWNSYFRGGSGQITLGVVEYDIYNFNNKLDPTGDTNGTIIEFNHLLTLSGVVYPGVNIFVSGGLGTMNFRLGSESVFPKKQYNSTLFRIGGELGLPLNDAFTFVPRLEYATFDAHTGPRGSGEDGWGQTWRVQGFLYYEVSGDRSSFFVVDLFVGGGYHYYQQRWTFHGMDMWPTPDNQANDNLQSGYPRFDAAAGMVVFMGGRMNLTFEAYLLGPFGLHVSTAFLF